MPDATVTVHNGGMNSATWFVNRGGRRFVAKAVDARAAREFRAGLAVATILDQAGIAAGAPVAAADGEHVVFVDGTPLALLTFVPGRELTGTTPDEQRLIGATLARVHLALADRTVADMDYFHWVDPDADHLQVRPWIRPAVAGAVEACARLGQLSQGLLHGDPNPGAFRLDTERDHCGVIDWSNGLSGPLLYDLASAVLYLGGPESAAPMVRAYVDQGVLSSSEVDRGLAVMLRFRWAVQADYFAHRIVTNDLTGIDSAAGNEKGLEDARQWFNRFAATA